MTKYRSVINVAKIFFDINSNLYSQNNEVLTQTKIKPKLRERETHREREREREREYL